MARNYTQPAQTGYNQAKQNMNLPANVGGFGGILGQILGPNAFGLVPKGGVGAGGGGGGGGFGGGSSRGGGTDTFWPSLLEFANDNPNQYAALERGSAYGGRGDPFGYDPNIYTAASLADQLNSATGEWASGQGAFNTQQAVLDTQNEMDARKWETLGPFLEALAGGSSGTSDSDGSGGSSGGMTGYSDSNTGQSASLNGGDATGTTAINSYGVGKDAVKAAADQAKNIRNPAPGVAGLSTNAADVSRVMGGANALDVEGEGLTKDADIARKAEQAAARLGVGNANLLSSIYGQDTRFGTAQDSVQNQLMRSLLSGIV